LLDGYAGTIVRIDVTKKQVTKSHTDPKLVEACLGGKGFGTRFLQNEIGRELDPLHPSSLLFFVVGPATGAHIPTASRYGVFFKSPLTGIYGESYSGGSFAPELKKAGFDAVIIEGRADNPTYLWLSDGDVEFREARSLWGLDTYETQDSIKRDLGDNKVEVASIGPAGENLVKFACICNDYWRQAGRCGAGAVMGSKNLKAIAVRGTQAITVAHPDELGKFVREFMRRIRGDPALGTAYPKYGTPSLVNMANLAGVFPTRYWSKGQFEKYEEINAEALREKILVSSKACLDCPIACGKLTEVKNGPYEGTKVEGPEYETIYAFGGLCEIDSLEAIAKMNDACDRLGMDTMTAGNAVAFAIEAYGRGRLQSEMPLRYGDAEAVLDLIGKMAARQGVGNLLAEGVTKASETLGLQDIAIHVKGLEPAGYDPRGLKGMALAYATSQRGACHLRSTEYIFELRGVTDKSSTAGKASLVKEYEDRFAIYDSLIICRFLRDVVDWNALAEICRLTTGLGFDEKKLRSIAERIVDESRLFNVKMGISRKDDYLPKRLMQEPLANGPLESQSVTRVDMDQMLDEYYGLRGWDENGIPKENRPASQTRSK
jgi:aldehyde:ferredoxin oxidoreductase